jgi:hypothetical protein
VTATAPPKEGSLPTGGKVVIGVAVAPASALSYPRILRLPPVT